MILTVMYQQWYFVGITHVPSHIAALRILRSSHINSERVSSVDLSYQPINEPPRYCSGIFFVFFVCFVCFLLFCKCATRKRKRKTKKTTLSLHNSAVFRSFVISFFWSSAERYQKGACLLYLFGNWRVVEFAVLFFVFFFVVV